MKFHGQVGNSGANVYFSPNEFDYWKIVQVGSNLYEIRPYYYDHLTIDVYQASTTDGTSVTLYDRKSQKNQRWHVMDSRGSGFSFGDSDPIGFSFAPQHSSGQRLDCDRGNGGNAIIWPSHGGDNQYMLFQIEK